MLHGRVRAAVVAVALLATGSARADDTLRRIGVVNATVINVPDERAVELSAALGEAIVAALPVEVIAGSESQRRLPSAGLPEDCLSRPECSTDIGRRLDADELLYLAIVAVGDSIKIEVTWVRVANADTRSRPSIQIGPEDDPSELLTAAVPELLPHISAEPNGETTKEPSPTVVVVSDTRSAGPERRMSTAAWILAGVGGAGLLGGTVFALSSWNKHAKLERRCAREDCAPSDIRSLERHTLAADVLLGVGLAAGAGSAILYYMSAEATEEAPPVSALPVPGGGQVVFGGRF